MPLPLTTIFLVFAVTISAVESSILYGLLPFFLAFLFELGRILAARGEADTERVPL